jgi:hypothetical protein
MQLIQFTVLANLVLIQIHCTVKLVFVVTGQWKNYCIRQVTAYSTLIDVDCQFQSTMIHILHCVTRKSLTDATI